MAWIESHQELERHPKTLRLMVLMGWGLDETIGKLHRFWWWCVDYAQDGDLRKYNDALIGSVVGLNSDDAKRFVEAMVNCGGESASGFIDRLPYFRVHDWWDRIGMFLQIKYKHQPERWQTIKNLYYNGSKNVAKNSTPNLTIPNLTKPNQVSGIKQTEKNGIEEEIVPVTNDVTESASKSSHVEFMERFKKSYESMTGEPFEFKKEQFIIVQRLIKKHGYDTVISKTKTLGAMCRDRSVWFTRGGWADFTIEKLSSQWNSILLTADPKSKVVRENDAMREIRLAEEQNERVNNMLKR